MLDILVLVAALCTALEVGIASGDEVPASNIPPDSVTSPPGSPLPPKASVESGTSTSGMPAISTAIPPFHLTKVQLTGEILKDRAAIEAEIEISVNYGEEWHRIPLRLNQAHVSDHSYEGPGSEAPSIEPVDNGIVWLIRGVGYHKLTLSLWVPLKKSLTEENLQLALPPLPPQFEATLRLRIPDQHIAIRPSRETSILETIVEDNASTVVASISGSRLDLSWKKVADSDVAVMQARSTMTLRRSGSRISLTVDQILQFDQQAPRQLRFRIPEQFQLIDVRGSAVRNGFAVDESAPGWVIVQFDESLSDRTDLQWRMDTDLPSAGRSLTLTGFEVERAATQDGVIRIEDLGLFQVRPRNEESLLVERVDTAAVRGTGVTPIVTAFEFYRQPFVLAVDLVPIVPSFAVIPEHDVLVSESGVNVQSRLRFDVDSGALQRALIQWLDPAMAWGVPTASLRVGQEEVSVSISQISPGRLEVIFPTLMTGSFELKMSFSKRSLDNSLEIKFPVAESPRQAPALIRVYGDERIETKVESVPREAFVDVTRSHLSDQDRSNFLQHELRSVGAGGALQLTGVVHDRTIGCNVAVHVDESTSEGLGVRQIIDLQVVHGKLGSVLLNLPPVFQQKNGNGTVWAIEASLNGNLIRDRQMISSETLLLTFPDDIRGQAELEIAFKHPVTLNEDGSPTLVDLPLIELTDAPRQSLRCVIHPMELVRVGDSQTWASVSTAPNGGVWISEDRSARSVPLVVSSDFVQNSQQFTVEQAFFRSRFSEDGLTTTAATFRLLAPSQRVVMHFPKTAVLDAVEVDGLGLNQELQITRKSSSEFEDLITFRLPQASIQRRLLTMRFHMSHPGNFGLASSLELPFPYFAAGVWTDETIWEVELPEGQHLVQSPRGGIPEFRWTRGGLFWKRELTADYLSERARWAQLAPFLETPSLERTYAFRQFGPMVKARLSSMNRSLILLTGAGTTLLLGFLFWKFPSTRNLFSIVLIGFCFAVASLWYLEPMQLLLQPAIFGFLLAAFATAVDAWRRPQLASNYSSSVRIPDERRLPSGSSVTHVPTTIYRPSLTNELTGSSTSGSQQ